MPLPLSSDMGSFPGVENRIIPPFINGYFSFDGLSMDTDFCYMIRGQYKISATQSHACWIYFNQDYTPGNYKRYRKTESGFNDMYWLDGFSMLAGSLMAYELRIQKMPKNMVTVYVTVMITAGNGQNYYSRSTTFGGADVLWLGTANVNRIDIGIANEENIVAAYSSLTRG